MKVVKKDGSMEDFDREKIIKSCVGCGASSDVAERVATEVEGLAHEGMRTSEIRNLVLERLRTVDPTFERNWLDHESRKTK